MKFCWSFCFLSKHNIYHYLYSWFYKNSVGHTHVSMRIHPLWCLCSCGFSVTFNNNFINFELRNTMFALILEKLYCSIESHCMLLENNTEAFMASCCYWKTFLWWMSPWRSRGKHITSPMQSNFQIFWVVFPICDLQTYTFVSLIIEVIFSLLLAHTVLPPFVYPWICSWHLRCYSELWYLLFYHDHFWAINPFLSISNNHSINN